MPFATIDGIKTNYQVTGSGTPLLMLAPGGFDSSIMRWSASGAWKELLPLNALADQFQVIAYDRREAGDSGGRIEPLTWELYVKQATGLLDHLGVDSAYMLGGCMGVSVALAIGRLAPKRVRGLLLHWPVGGYRWMLKGRGFFDGQIAYVREHGLAGVLERAKELKTFWRGDPSGGPWSAALANDPALAESFVKQELAHYIRILERSRDTLFNDTMPSGATGEQLIAMQASACVMTGDDASHAHSAAVALRELLPKVQMSPLMPPQQSGAAVGAWIRDSVQWMQTQ
jgi:pimeloyl-ACP methyl ester carboxylesterase